MKGSLHCKMRKLVKIGTLEDWGCVKTGILKWKMRKLSKDKNLGRRGLCKYGDLKMEDGEAA